MYLFMYAFSRSCITLLNWIKFQVFSIPGEKMVLNVIQKLFPSTSLIRLVCLLLLFCRLWMLRAQILQISNSPLLLYFPSWSSAAISLFWRMLLQACSKISLSYPTSSFMHWKLRWSKMKLNGGKSKSTHKSILV